MKVKNQTIPVEKNKEYIVEILDNGSEGEGIAKIDGYTVFVNGAIKGEKCKILIVKITASHAYGKLIEIIEKSEHRTKPDCATYQRCGGCSLRHITYPQTLEMKRQMIQNLINKTFNSPMMQNQTNKTFDSLMMQNQTNKTFDSPIIEVKKTIGMQNPYHYRNKAQYPFGYNKNGEKVFGIYAQRTHEIIEAESCKIQNPIAEKIAKEVLKFIKENNISVYNETTQKGIFRHLVVKVGIKTKEVMCILVLHEEKFAQEKDFVSYFIQEVNQKLEGYTIKTIVKNINHQNTNVILGDKNIVLYGDGYIYDKLGKYIFKISPMSFYQTNTVQTEVLYQKAIQVANLKNTDIVLDLYCGIGTIGIYASSFVKQVYGIEIVKQAIQDAKENARMKGVENVSFTCGDVEEVLKDLVEKENIKPNVIFVDPPRRGLDQNTINNILWLKPEKLIYISCNPATMVRDLKLLEAEYETKEIEPVDMFPFTSHVECVAVLQLKQNR